MVAHQSLFLRVAPLQAPAHTYLPVPFLSAGKQGSKAYRREPDNEEY